MKKTDFLKKLKAGLLAGTMAATLSACTKEEKDDIQNSMDAARYEMEESTRTTTAENDTQETSTEKVMGEKEEKTESKETTNNNGETVQTTTKGRFMTPTKAEKNNTSTTPVTTQSNTNNTTKNNTTTSVGTKTPVTTKATTTTTKAVQTTTQRVTQAPVTTTTVPVKQNYTKYDMQNSDPEVAAKAFEQLADELREELFKGYYVSDESYGMTAGYEQSKIILAALNYYNGGISPETLAHNDALGKLSREDMEKYCINLDLPQEQYLYGSRVDFNKYVIDDDFADEIEKITDIYFDWKDNGNSETLEVQLDEYCKNNNYDCLESVGNFAEFYYMCTIDCEYESLDYLNETHRNTLREHLIIPMYESYEQYKGQKYSR